MQGINDVMLLAGLSHEYVNGEQLAVGFVGASTVAKSVGSSFIHKLKIVRGVFAKK